MTFVGKLLVIFQVVLSVFFMAFAITVYNVQTNWKKSTQTAKTQVQAGARETEEIRAEFDKFKTDNNAEIVDITNKMEKAEALNKSLSQELSQSQKKLNSALTDRDNQTTQARAASEEADSRTSEAEKQRKINVTVIARLNTSLTKLSQEESKNFNLTVEKQVLIGKYNSLIEEVATIKEIALAGKFDINIERYKAKTAPPPNVDGLIVDTVSNKRGLIDLVEITLGSNDGLAVGHTLTVYSEKYAKYKATINIISVEPNKAVGSVNTKSKRGIIERGDNVTTKL